MLQGLKIWRGGASYSAVAKIWKGGREVRAGWGAYAPPAPKAHSSLNPGWPAETPSEALLLYTSVQGAYPTVENLQLGGATAG